MKITIDFENGMNLSVKPENLSIVDFVDKDGTPKIGIAFKTDVSTVPFLFFNGLQIATKEELDVRKYVACTAAKAAAQPPAPPAEPTGGAVNPPAPEPPATPAA